MAKGYVSPARENTVDSKPDLRVDPSHGGQAAGELGEAQQSPVLVLSRYSALIETVRKAAPRGVPVVQAPDVEHATAKMRSVRPGVLVVDTASTSDMAALVAELTAYFPTMVIVAAGQRDDSDALMQLRASGQIFRFLLVPLSHGQTRLTLDAAIAEHNKMLTASAPRPDERSAMEEGAKKSDLAGYVALAVGLVLSVGGIWWFASRTTSEPEAPAAASTTTSVPTIAIVSQSDPLQTALALAQGAFARGEYIEPAGRSALDYYRSALSKDPTSIAAQEGIRSVASKILERAESALNAQRIEDAITAVATARVIDPQHPRLAFFDALVERAKQSQAQDLSRRVKALVAKAQELMNQGRLVTPQSGNARDTLLEAKRLDPTNSEVTRGLRDLAQALAQDASRLIKAGNLDEAQSLVASARQLDLEGVSLAAVESALTAARNNAVASQPPRPAPLVKASPPPAPVANPVKDVGKELVADVRRTLSEGKLIEPKGDNAKETLAMLRAMDPRRAELNELARSLSDRLLESGKQALAAKAFDRSQQFLNAARDVGAPGNDVAISQAERELMQARASFNININNNKSGEASNIVAAATLQRIRTVEPVYPIAARRRREEGMVEVVFTVTPEGGVENVEVRKSSPELVFDDAAKQAVAQWRFEPVKVNGESVSQRAFARLRFSLD